MENDCPYGSAEHHAGRRTATHHGIGYCSHFHQPGTIEGLGGDVVAQVIAWLDEEAEKPAWRSYVEASRQGIVVLTLRELDGKNFIRRISAGYKQ